MKEDSNFKLTKSFKGVLILACLFFLINSLGYSQWKKASGKFANSNISNFVALDSLLFAGTVKNGIIISEDNGKTWNKNIPLKYPLRWLYNFDGILIGFFGHEHTYIVCSKDRGNTWEEIPTDTLYNNISKFIYSLTFHNHEIYITNGKGIFKTKDWGKTWLFVSNKFGYQSTIVSFDNYLYASNKKIGMWYSINNGKNWVIDENISGHSIAFQKINRKLVTGFDGFLYELNKPGGIWKKAFDTKLGLILRIAPFCCNSYILAGNNIIFTEENIISLPKVPISYDYMIANAMINNKNIITISFTNHHIWNLEYKLKLEY